jgi:hypothetical protein
MCRLADHIGLPSRQQLVQFYGGRKRLPEHPWGDYYANVVLARKDGFQYSRQVDWLQHGESEFRKQLDQDEVGIIISSEVSSGTIFGATIKRY